MSDASAGQLISSAYRDLSVGLRSLAATLETPDSTLIVPDVPIVAIDDEWSVEDVAGSFLEQARITIAYAGMSGAVLIAGFHVAMMMFPPLRATTLG